MASSDTPPKFGRIITAMVTPFDDNNLIDEAQLAKLVDHLIGTGSDGLVVCGTTGEAPTLSHDEKLKMFTLVKKYAGTRAKVLAGTGSNNTADSIILSKQAEEIGVDGLLLIAPYYNRPSQQGLFEHFSAIAKSVPKMPILLYNVPPRTSVNIEAKTVARCAQHNANIVGVKEASSDLPQISDIARLNAKQFMIYSGEDGVNLPILAVGGVGTISVTSHVAGKALRLMHEAFFAGDVSYAANLHNKTVPLTRALFCVNSPTPTKYALAKLGILTNPKVRLPLSQITDEEAKIVDKAMADFGV